MTAIGLKVKLRPGLKWHDKTPVQIDHLKTHDRGSG